MHVHWLSSISPLIQFRNSCLPHGTAYSGLGLLIPINLTILQRHVHK